MASKTGSHQPRDRCHNCRRQRLRCDKSYPQCNKCILNGKECLGYGQLFRWTGAIASRGKLAGKTSNAKDAGLSSITPSKEGWTYSAHTSSGSPHTSPADFRERVESSTRSSPAPSPDATLSSTESTPRKKHIPYDEWQMIPIGRFADAAPPRPWVLADPLVQDLSKPYRYYLSYCMRPILNIQSLPRLLINGL